MLALQAADLMEHPTQADDAPGIASIAARLGISDRHLRRIFEAHWGITPLRYLQTRRLLTAKQLLTDTRLPVADVAALSGFASVRRFNAVFVAALPATTYGAAQIDTLTRPRQPSGNLSEMAIRCAIWRLRPQLSVSKLLTARPSTSRHLLDFFANRAIAGVEWVDAANGLIRRSISLPHKGTMLRGWVEARLDAEEQLRVQLRISESLASALPVVLNRIRAWLDLDADPAAMDPMLCPDFAGSEGIRVPGTLDGLELAVRAILGQQITVKAARTLTARLVDHCGIPLARSA